MHNIRFLPTDTESGQEIWKLSRVCLDRGSGILHYEMFSEKTDPIRISEGNKHQGAEIPTVNSYGIYSLMREHWRKPRKVLEKWII
ncbi:hypothetical protein [Rhodoflexus sp.]